MADSTGWLAGTGVGIAALVGIYSNLGFQIASATNSSPQTTELFAGQRSDTLWKWVKIGSGIMLAYGLAASILSKSILPLLAMVIVIGAMGGMYYFALKWGQENNS